MLDHPCPEEKKSWTDRECRDIDPFRIYFVRHAQSQNNARSNQKDKKAKLPARQADPGITEVGEQQAACAGGYFKAMARAEQLPQYKKVVRVYTSLMRRALQTVKHMDVRGEGWAVCGSRDIHEAGGVFTGERSHSPSGRGSAEAAVHLDHGLDKEGVQGVLGSDGKGVALANLDELELQSEKGWWRGGYETSDETEARAIAQAEHIWKIVEERFESRRERRRLLHDDGAYLVVTHGLFHDRLKRHLLGNTGASADIHCHFPTCNVGVDVFDFKIHPITKQRLIAVVELNNDHFLPEHLKNGGTCGVFKVAYSKPPAT